MRDDWKDLEIYWYHPPLGKIISPPFGQSVSSHLDDKFICDSCGSRYKDRRRYCPHCGEKEVTRLAGPVLNAKEEEKFNKKNSTLKTECKQSRWILVGDGIYRLE